jgi:predicted membrane-bound mannosyltransferase
MTPRDTERSPLLATKLSSSSSSWRRALAAAAAVVVVVVEIFATSRPAHEFGVERRRGGVRDGDEGVCGDVFG